MRKGSGRAVVMILDKRCIKSIFMTEHMKLTPLSSLFTSIHGENLADVGLTNIIFKKSEQNKISSLPGFGGA